MTGAVSDPKRAVAAGDDGPARWDLEQTGRPDGWNAAVLGRSDRGVWPRAAAEHPGGHGAANQRPAACRHRFTVWATREARMSPAESESSFRPWRRPSCTSPRTARP